MGIIQEIVAWQENGIGPSVAPVWVWQGGRTYLLRQAPRIAPHIQLYVVSRRDHVYFTAVVYGQGCLRDRKAVKEVEG